VDDHAEIRPTIGQDADIRTSGSPDASHLARHWREEALARRKDEVKRHKASSYGESDLLIYV
jgi:hypothetical protein